MSVMRPVLNLWLRLTEKPHLAKASDPDKLRRSFETKARLFFHAPRGTQKSGRVLAGRAALEIASAAPNAPMILYFHGGGYVFGSPRTHSAMIAQLCQIAGARAVLPDYRKAPEYPHPAAIQDAEAAYLALLSEGEDPKQIVVGGDSAGGGLALALIAVLLAKEHPLPAGAFAFSPLTDLTYSSPSVSHNAASDVVLPASRVHDMTEAFIGDRDRTDPLASPLFAEFAGAPPLWIAVGDTEILLDDSRNMTDRLKKAGVEVDLTIERDLPHVWPIFHNFLPEAKTTLHQLAGWIKTRTR